MSEFHLNVIMAIRESESLTNMADAFRDAMLRLVEAK